MLTTSTPFAITWEKLPDNFVLDDDPVDNINQPLLAAALSESLQLSGKLPASALTTTHYGICATVNQKIVVKAPDWSCIPAIRVPREDVDRSYTPQLQGDIPAVVMEFLSATDGGEYSVKPTHPPGKWLFYEQILAVPTYVIFALDTGALEVYHLDEAGRYQLSTSDVNDRYWIGQMNLFLGVWQGTRENCTGNWLRWWDDAGNLLLWGFEKAAQLQEKAAQQQQRADRLAAQLRAAGIEPGKLIQIDPPYSVLNGMKIKHAINLHKGLTAAIVVGFMVAYQNFTLGPWVYLALHGSYGFLWLLKDRLYPDKQWEQVIPLKTGVFTFALLGLYWVPPFLLISRGTVPPLPLVAGAIALNILGVFLHFVSDAQKYYTLKYREGLITEGLFARCRNTNYLGEVLIYLSFALLAQHWLPFAILALFISTLFVPNMLKKDRLLSRYPDFASYKARSGLLLPTLSGMTISTTDGILPTEEP